MDISFRYHPYLVDLRKSYNRSIPYTPTTPQRDADDKYYRKYRAITRLLTQNVARMISLLEMASVFY